MPIFVSGRARPSAGVYPDPMPDRETRSPDCSAAAPVFDADSTLVYLDRPARRLIKRAVALAGLGIFIVYLAYRAAYTFNTEAPVFAGLVYFAEVHGFFSLLFYYHQCWALRGRQVPTPPPGLKVDVFITTYNEDVDLLRQTVRGAIAMRYPHRTFVLDDGRREAVRLMADALGAHYLTRADNRHAKAGNWNSAFAKTDADLIATFDADHVPREAFLERTLGFFQDPRVALVQVPQQYHNLDSVQHRVNWTTRRLYGEQDVFFNLVMPGKDHYNAAFFCGTGAVLRRSALTPHGGIITGTITEDLHTSIVLHSEGWKSVYLNEMLVTGLAPTDFKSFDVQRLRWAEGNLKTMGHINPLTCGGLTLNQRINYAASLYHWTIGVPKLIFYLAPPWMLLTRTFPIVNFDQTFLTVYLTFLATLLVSYKVMSSGTGWLLMDELFNMASFFTMLRALKRAIFGRGEGTFVVTSKTGGGGAGREVIPHFALLGFSIMALSWSWMGLGFGITDDWFGASIASFWTFYNMGLVWYVLRLATRPPQKRRAPRFRVNFPVRLADEPGLGMTGDFSEGGCTVLWTSPLTVGRRIDVEMHVGDRTVTRHGEVLGYHQPQDGWVAHRVRFIDLTQADIDDINDAIFHFAIPSLFERLSEPWWLGRIVRRAKTRRGHARETWRHGQTLPLRVRHAGGEFLAITRDESHGGLGFVAPQALATGTTITASLTEPRGERSMRLTVVRSRPLPTSAAYPAFRIGAQFDRRAWRGRQDDDDAAEAAA